MSDVEWDIFLNPTTFRCLHFHLFFLGPTDGEWKISDNAKWGSCSTSCDEGVETKKKVCVYADPNCKGKPCTGDNVAESRPCNTEENKQCKIYVAPTILQYFSQENYVHEVSCRYQLHDHPKVIDVTAPGLDQIIYTILSHANFSRLQDGRSPPGRVQGQQWATSLHLPGQLQEQGRGQTCFLVGMW